jgi:hypothetical protein
MIGMKIDQAKAMFFDRKKVQRSADRATVRVLSRFGAYVRQTARRSIRPAPKKKLKDMTHEERAQYKRAYAIDKRKGKPLPKRPMVERGSPAGQPPYSRTGLLREFIFFVYDRMRRSVIIGPARFARKTGNAPEALEYGGRSKATTRGKTYSIFIESRPFMHPAFEQEKPKLPGMWQDSIKP